MPSGADLVIIPAKQVVCKPHDTMRVTANRFENDLVRQPQADCLRFPNNPSEWTEAVCWCLLQTEPTNHRCESDIFSLALIDTVTELSLMARKIYGQPLHFELVYLQHRSAWLGYTPKACSNSPWDSRWEHSRRQWQNWVADRDVCLIYCMWSDCRGVRV